MRRVAKGRPEEIAMTTEVERKEKQKHSSTVSRTLREQVKKLLNENYAYMDSSAFRRKYIERELFAEDVALELPLTSWYQPTRDEALSPGSSGQPQLMKPEEERLMFLRFNYAKKRLLA